MRPLIKVEDGEGEVRSDELRGEEADAGRERRRRPNEGAAAATDATQSLRTAHAEAQRQAFGEMERARVMELELQQAKADVARLQAEAKVKDEAFQAVIRSKDDQLRSKDAVIESKEQLLQAEAKVKDEAFQAVIRSKDEQLSLLLISKDAVIESKDQLLQAKDAEIRRLHADVARCSAESAANGAARQPAQARAAPAPAPAAAPAPDPAAAAALAAAAPPPALGRVAASSPGFLSKFGSCGASNGQFNFPRLMAWDQQGNVVVADETNHRLQVVRLSDGACLRTIGSRGSIQGTPRRGVRQCRPHHCS